MDALAEYINRTGRLRLGPPTTNHTMQFGSLILAASALVASAFAETPEKHHRHRHSSSSSSSVADWTSISSSSEERTSVNLMVDNGYYAFTYGNANTFAFQSFIVNSKHLTILSISDCFLPGDIFQVYDNGQYMMVTDICPDGPVAHPQPDELEKCPATCFQSCSFCKNFGYLLPGWHNITIAVLRSASTAGAGYLRVDTACQADETCTDNLNRYPQPCCQLDGHQACSQNISPYGFADDMSCYA